MGLPLGNAVLSGRSVIGNAPHPPKSPRPRAVPVTRVNTGFPLTTCTPLGFQNPLQTPRRRKATKDRLGGRMKKYTHRQLPAHSPRQPTPRTLAESLRILAQRSGAGRPHCRPRSKLQSTSMQRRSLRQLLSLRRAPQQPKRYPDDVKICKKPATDLQNSTQ